LALKTSFKGGHGMDSNAAISMAQGGVSYSWVSRADLGLISRQVGTPVFIYSEEQLARNVRRIHEAASVVGIEDRIELFVPFFPNSNPHVLEPLQALGVGLLLQLPNEFKMLQKFAFKKFIVSPGHVSDQEIDFWARTPYPTFLSSLDEVGHALQANAQSISVRIDSLASDKPGIKYAQLDRLSEALRSHQRHLECFEVYCGSGNSLGDMIKILEQIFTIFKTHFPTARSINFAGGHGFSYEKWDETEKHFAWRPYFEAMHQLSERMGIPREVKFLFEPARDVLADTGMLLLGVKRNIIENPISKLVVTDGSRMLMPSAQLRGRRHNLLFWDGNLRELKAPQAAGTEAALRGRSILRNDYVLPGTYRVPSGVGAGCYVGIMDVGAYCATQHMEFLNVPPAAEVMIDRNGTCHLVTQRGDELDKWRNLLSEKRELKAS
jgi:diaminopimelate decarboxylase